ncbi:DUF459 domain-containing protein [Tepidiforma sp.]|uniref:SGNH/GDSL hydrolase family protein n=1 Tax=Tepidiforma sp. TaxID=2682230 RepID=UPI002ADE4814|nr:DUF459 domain-containing protein [Tepidiforma sp.]
MADATRRPSRQRLGARPGRVFGVMVGGLLLAVLLNAPALERGAESMPYGRERDFWLAVWKPFAAVSRALFLDEPRNALDRLLGRDHGGDLFELPASPGDGGTPAPGETPAPTPVQGRGTPAPTATPTPDPRPKLRTPTAADPLRVWIGGDSMAKVLGEAFLRQAAETGVIAATHDPQLSSGLTRPDFFDWPGHFNSLVQNGNYEVFIVMFGANDSQGIRTPDGKIFQPGEEGWTAEYRRRVAGVMDLLGGNNRLVLWLGQPIMRSAEFSERMAALNVIYREEAAKRPWVRFIDLWPLFTTPSGGYDAYLQDDDGEVKEMRHPDGVHFVRDGAERASRAIMAVLKEEAGLAP